jgi:hypothetical protein
MKTAGVVFDFYDDPNGSLLKQAFPTADVLPEAVKTAHILTPEEREVLRDEAYALVAVNEGKVLRKFACVDAGNTLLSMLYFEKNASLLPEEARAAVAARLLQEAEAFKLPYGVKTAAQRPDVTRPTDESQLATKQAEPDAKDAKRKAKGEGRQSGMSRERDSMQQPLVGDEADWAARTNLVSVRGGADSGKVIPTAQQMNKAAMLDLTGKEPAPVFQKRASENSALGGKYPLDSYADIRAAVDYFKQHWTDFDPVERHVFSVKTASRADEIGLEVPDVMRRYGSMTYAEDVDAHLANRKANCEEKFHGVYDAMLEKQAEIHPEDFADLLSQADVAAGLNWYWGGAITDPWFATFGPQTNVKTAFAWEGSGYTINAEQLEDAAANGALEGNFDKEIVKAFEKDPVAIFSSLPDDSKAIIARLASEG